MRHNFKIIKEVIYEIFTHYMVFLILFSLFRITLLFKYFELFNNLTYSQLILCLMEGIRFDLASTSVILLLPIFLLIFPLKFSGNSKYRMFIHSLIYIELILLLLFLLGNLFYFSFVNRHITSELFLLINDVEYLFLEAKSYYLVFVPFLIIIIIFFPYFLSLHKRINPSGHRSLTAYLVILLPIIAIGRGGFQMKPIAVIDAYRHGNSAMGNLILNGFFSASHYSISTNYIDRKITSESDYIKTLKLPEPQDTKYPLEKIRKKTQKNNSLNLVIIMVESLSPKYIDSISKNNYFVTENLDKLIPESIFFPNFFANGQRSIDGVQSIITSVPPLPGIPDIISLSANFPSLANILKKNDYRTIFISSTLRESFSLNLIAESIGFEEYYGKEDYPLILSYPEGKDRPLGWDYEALMFLFDKLMTTNERFFALINASSNHTPFARLQKPFDQYVHGNNSEGGYLNMLQYTDWSIGKFIDKFRLRSDFEDTVFVITSDHAMAHFQTNKAYEKFLIPLIIYSPKHIEPKIIRTYGSQIDILSTIVDILDLEATYSSIGTNLLKKKTNYVIVKEGLLTNIISDKGFLQHSIINIVDFKANNTNLNEDYQYVLERKLLAFDHLVYSLVNTNRLNRP